MVKKKIQIRGDKVHDVGYRLFLMNAAEDFGIKNFDAKNVKDVAQIVIVLVESAEENINQFFDYVKTNLPENAIVSTVNIENYDKEVKNIEVFKTSFVAVQQQKFVNVGLMLYGEVKMFRKESNEKQDKMLEKQDVMIEKQDKMLEKQDVMIEKQDKMLEKQDVMIEKQDKMLEKQDVMIEKQDKMLEKQDVMIEKQDKMLEKQDIMIDKQDKMLVTQNLTINVLMDIRENTSKIPYIVEKIQDIDVKYTRLEEEINKIKRAIHIEV